jgi:hypothetical protein
MLQAAAQLGSTNQNKLHDSAAAPAAAVSGAEHSLGDVL